jgi:hypothetical protein
MNTKNAVTPRFTVEITEQEKNRAVEIKKQFKQILREMDKSLQIVYDLRDAIVQDRPSKEDLKSRYAGRMLRYRRVIVKAFNSLLTHLRIVLNNFSLVIDPEMLKLRGIIVAEFDELSDGIESLLALLGDVDREGFTKSLENITAQLERRQRSIKNSIDDQLFGHLENDILGKMKISSLKARIIKRTRLLRKL